MRRSEPYQERATDVDAHGVSCESVSWSRE